MKKLKSNHDRFFSQSLELLPIARDFFKNHLPDSLQPSIDLSSLERADRKNTDLKLKQRQRDSIYKTLINQTNTCFLCLEHQSQGKWNIPLRLLQYQLDTLRMHMNAGNRDWPLVISMLLYHGEASPYPHPTTSTAYYQNPSLGDQHLYFKFYLIDLTKTSDEQIITHGLCAPMELLLKHSRDADFELAIAAYRGIFHTCIETIGDEYLEAMLTYATNLSKLEIGEKVYNFIKQVLENKKDVAMTYAAKLKQEGKQEGRLEGKQEGKQEGRKEEKIEIARNMRKKGIEIKLIKEITGLSDKAIKEI